MRRPLIKIHSAMALLFCVTALSFSANYYVATTGNNSNAGTNAAPFKTIQKAADVMRAGDTTYIRGGIYREFVQPAQAGSSETQRIVYKAYPNEVPSIRGSEVITGWIQNDNGSNVWRVDILDSFFGSYNPYVLKISPYEPAAGGIYPDSSCQWHLGDVWINGTPLKERKTQNELNSNANTWYTSHAGTTTTIYANFNGTNPNTGLAEISVREMCFYPSVVGLKYITVDGLEMKQIANNWTNFDSRQTACIGVKWGMYWLIQNCHISDAKTSGITLGTWETTDNEAYPVGKDMNTLGHHIVRNNLIERCGEHGICASGGGASASIIEGNLIQDINYKRELGGWETAGIKFHWLQDAIIRNNVIRRVRNLAVNNTIYPGIWLDWAAAGVRITGNVIYDIGHNPIYIEVCHGPILIDNNIVMGTCSRSDSERLIWVHNLFFKGQPLYQQY